MKVAFFGSSLLSSYWNGAATYYRGLLKALARHGYDIAFYEPDAFDRQAHRDIDPPPWCRSVVYEASPEGLRAAAAAAANADIVVVASGVGYGDDVLLDLVMAAAPAGAVRIFWDVDAPATLAALQQAEDHPLRRHLPALDLVLTYGGGAPVVTAYRQAGAAACVPVYNALDPQTHHPVPSESRFEADLSFLGNRLPDREARVRQFLLQPARARPDSRVLLGGAGWEPAALPDNVHCLGHVPTRDHNAFNCSPKAVLNIARDSMAATGFSPATRVFEAAGAGACLITDPWEGIEMFLAPGREVLVARDGQDVADLMGSLTRARALAIGAAALARVRADHTYERRAGLVDEMLRARIGRKTAGEQVP